MNHLGDTNKMVGEDHIRDATKMVSDTPSICPFCGSYVATLDDGKSCGDSEGNWVAFRCLTSWHRGYHDPRKLQSKTCETVERHKLYDRIKRMEEAGDAMASILNNTRKDWYTSDQCEVTAFTWNEAKEAKP